MGCGPIPFEHSIATHTHTHTLTPEYREGEATNEDETEMK